MNERSKKIIVAVDVGTTKICTLIASTNAHSELEILGIGSHPCHGLKKGSVVDMEKTTTAIKNSLDEAKLMAGVPISKVNVGIAGGHIYSFNNTAVIALKHNEVTAYDLQKAIEAARTVIIPDDREILHVIPQSYKLDSIAGIKDPLGMKGQRLEINVHIVTAHMNLVQNLVKCVEQAGVGIDEIYLQPLCSSEAVLLPEEKELGVVLVDIGGGTTDLAIWKDGSLMHSHVIPLGGNHFTNDLAIALKIPYSEAEKIKIEHGCVVSSKVNSAIHISVQGLTGTRPREAKLSFIAEILGSRAEELLYSIREIIEDKNLQRHVVGGYVFTGGGSLIKLLPELGEYILERPTKIGLPAPIGGMSNPMQNPKYSTVLGLLLQHQRNVEKRQIYLGNESRKNDLIRKLSESLKNVFKEIF